MNNQLKILIVCSINSGKIAPFISEQVDSLINAGLSCEYYGITGKGIIGYLNSRKGLLAKIREFQPDIIHAHYGLSGLLANTQRKVPVVTTYHGSDINETSVLPFSKISMRLSAHNVFVSEKIRIKAGVKDKYSIIPCGVDLEVFYPQDKLTCRKMMSLDTEKRYVLFAGAFENPVKNSKLAFEAIQNLKNTKLLELKGYNRQQVSTLINAVDVCLMTSLNEGSPQFIKEALACNCPVVSVNVGDIKTMIDGIENCYVVDYDPKEISDAIAKIQVGVRLKKGRDKIIEKELEQKVITRKLRDIYLSLMK